MDLDVPSLFQNRRTVEEDPRFQKAWDGMRILCAHEAVEVTPEVWLLLLHVSTGCAFHLRLCKTRDLQRKPKSHGHFDVCAIDINASWLSASMATLHLNSTPYHLHGWCQAERQWALHLPLCPDTFRYYMQEMCFSRKAGYFRNCCNAIEWRLLILSLGPSWL